MSKNSLMIDLETLSTSTNAAILSIGAVRFDHTGEYKIDQHKDTFYHRIDIDDEVFQSLNLTIDQTTIDWWGRQSPEAIEAAFSHADRSKIKTVFLDLKRFALGAKYVWSNGAGFDVVICENIFKKLSIPVPWKYYNIRDCRTIYDIGIDPKLPNTTQHHALEDAIAQAIAVQNVNKELKKLFDNSHKEEKYQDDNWETRSKTTFDAEQYAKLILDRCFDVVYPHVPEKIFETLKEQLQIALLNDDKNEQ